MWNIHMWIYYTLDYNTWCSSPGCFLNLCFKLLVSLEIRIWKWATILTQCQLRANFHEQAQRVSCNGSGPSLSWSTFHSASEGSYPSNMIMIFPKSTRNCWKRMVIIRFGGLPKIVDVLNEPLMVLICLVGIIIKWCHFSCDTNVAPLWLPRGNQLFF